MMRSWDKSRGFTIVEILVVISVLAILISISIPRMQGMQQSSNMTKVNKEIATIITALEAYRTFDSSQAYPPSSTTVQASYLLKATPNIINSVLDDPFASAPTTEYNYLRSTNGNYYVVWSVGPGGASQPKSISDTGVISY